jgi:hypothetical protein
VYGVLYAAMTPRGAFVETFFRDLPTRIVSITNLRKRVVSTLSVGRPIRLVSAHGAGLVKLGTTAAVSAARNESPGIKPWKMYEHSQAWSRAAYEHPDAPDGIAFNSSHDDGLLCAAIFDRAADAIRQEGGPDFLHSNKRFLAEVVNDYKVSLFD